MKSSRNTPTHFAIRPCTLGFILVALSSQGLFAIQLADNPLLLQNDFQHHYPQAILTDQHSLLEKSIVQIMAVLENPALKINMPLDAGGTPFQQRVWKTLQAIPVGTTSSYTDIAQRIGAPSAVRAVANACAANPLAIIIPCHRIVKRNGDLSGYRWGLARKVALLDREQRLNPPIA